MLYDPKWETTKLPVKTETFSLGGLIQWLETQNSDAKYSYTDIHGCLLSKYFRACGLRWACCGPGRVSYSVFFLPPIFSKPIPFLMDAVAVSSPHTFGAALDRARELSRT